MRTNYANYDNSMVISNFIWSCNSFVI